MGIISEAVAAGGELPAGAAEAATAITRDGGVLGGIIVLLFLAIAGMWVAAIRRQTAVEAILKEEREAHAREVSDLQKQIHDANNERFKEMREVLNAINNSTGALNAISQSQADRSQTLAEVAKAMSELMNLTRGIYGHLAGQAGQGNNGMRQLPYGDRTLQGGA